MPDGILVIKFLKVLYFFSSFFSFHDFIIILMHTSVVLCCLPRILPASHLPTIRLLFLPYTQNLNFVQGGNMLIQKYFPVFFGVRNDHTTIKEAWLEACWEHQQFSNVAFCPFPLSSSPLSLLSLSSPLPPPSFFLFLFWMTYRFEYGSGGPSFEWHVAMMVKDVFRKLGELGLLMRSPHQPWTTSLQKNCGTETHVLPYLNCC